MNKHITNKVLITIVVILFLYAAINTYLKSYRTRNINRILLVVAMDAEATPIIRELNLNKSDAQFDALPMQVYEGQFERYRIMMIENGIDPINQVRNVGTQAATLATYLGIERFHPDLIISIGTAGGINAKGAAIGDIYFSKNIYFYDRRIAMPKYQDYGVGGYKSINFDDLASKIGFKTGIVCSGNSFDDNKTDQAMFSTLQCSAVDMEAAGVAWVSMLTKTPMLAIKGITNDVVGTNIHDDYRRNVDAVTNNLAEKLKLLLVNM